MRHTVYRYALPFKETTRTGYLLRLQDGVNEGWGEIAPLPGFSRESLDEALDDLITKRHTLPSVQFGYHTALADIKSPLEISSIPVKKKTKAGHLSLHTALQTIAPTSTLRIDMNRSWILEDALALADQLGSIEYYEEPLKVDEDATAFPFPVALDESLRTSYIPPYPNVVAHVIKPTLHGYPLPIPQQGVAYILSSSYETELGLYQIAKLAYRLNLPLRPMGLATYHLFKEHVFQEPLHIHNNTLYFPKTWTPKIDRLKVVFDADL